ncbi:TadE/TadG family type IV pilus assembly protein [Paenibacillus glycanilyticus]|uniref:TadE/TadG family type IV pilus assembly protein n=1 Tax=Paenibacillus glycanilyticus TaxID=126569 RepID=UPI0024E141B3|nr:TadE/TadG family type IV pilus assembly protein [Paenibacillus glycanilyticus]
MIEFMGILPLFLLMIIIVCQFAISASAAVTAKAAAMDGARVAITENSDDYETAVRNVASSYKVLSVARSESSDGKFTYVTVKVTLEVPLLNNARVFNTTGLSIPVSSEVTLKKEE